MSKVFKADAIKLIGEQLAQIGTLRRLAADTMEFKTWKQTTSLYIEKIFGSESKNLKSFEKIHFVPIAWAEGMDESYWYPRCFNGGLDESQVLLGRLMHEVELFGEDSLAVTARVLSFPLTIQAFFT